MLPADAGPAAGEQRGAAAGVALIAALAVCPAQGVDDLPAAALVAPGEELGGAVAAGAAEAARKAAVPDASHSCADGGLWEPLGPAASGHPVGLRVLCYHWDQYVGAWSDGCCLQCHHSHSEGAPFCSAKSMYSIRHDVDGLLLLQIMGAWAALSLSKGLYMA